MEFLLHLWDELDDLVGVGRHVTMSAAAEVAALSAPLATWASAIGMWLLLPQFRLNAALLAGTATFWSVYRHLLRLAA